MRSIKPRTPNLYFSCDSHCSNSTCVGKNYICTGLLNAKLLFYQVLSHTAGAAALVGWAVHAKRPAGQTMAVRFRWTAASVSATHATTVHLVTCSVGDEALVGLGATLSATAATRMG